MSKVLLIGNDINSINNPLSWEMLLERILEISNYETSIKEKPFPLLYEEIYLDALTNVGITEKELKTEIAKIIGQIGVNEIHRELIKLNCDHYLTTNYDYTLEKVLLEGNSTNSLENSAEIKETKYSLFRKNKLENKCFWHIHGEINVPLSITLGYEHYGGQIQQSRDYIVTGKKHTDPSKNKPPLRKQILDGVIDKSSWINFFFQDEVHILGLKLGYEETDLWWLLNSRARFFKENSLENKSRVIYYCPSDFKDDQKTEIMNAWDIETVFIDLVGLDYYMEVIKRINNGL